ncbi:uncharacterized protein RCC_08023 [Ramularia collo-cygni]|uniref:Uncharacterized protein n=1 Tax=Ramularia collo-cygni TaxID=112498 RepID=A0A2D3VGV0_9PEZI|nr:uncharacterized protein RCC_08023 [Ramularia collo-cygni]CZT22154.1 uncharacterized protein RCC_08023 [Ramularia collo-cygni]
MGVSQSKPETRARDTPSLHALPTETLNQIALHLRSAADVVSLHQALWLANDPAGPSGRLFWADILRNLVEGLGRNAALAAAHGKLLHKEHRDFDIAARKLMVTHIMRTKRKELGGQQGCMDCLGPLEHGQIAKDFQNGVQLCSRCHVGLLRFARFFENATTVCIWPWLVGIHGRPPAASPLGCILPSTRSYGNSKIYSITGEEASLITTTYQGSHLDWQAVLPHPFSGVGTQITNRSPEQKKMAAFRFETVLRTANLILHWPYEAPRPGEVCDWSSATMFDLDMVLISSVGVDVQAACQPMRSTEFRRDLFLAIGTLYDHDAESLKLGNYGQDQADYKNLLIRQWGIWATRRFFYAKLASNQSFSNHIVLHETDLMVRASFERWNMELNVNISDKLCQRIYGYNQAVVSLPAEPGVRNMQLGKYLFILPAVETAMLSYDIRAIHALNYLLLILERDPVNGNFRRNEFSSFFLPSIRHRPKLLIRAVTDSLSTMIDELDKPLHLAPGPDKRQAQLEDLSARMWNSDFLKAELEGLKKWALSKYVWIVLDVDPSTAPPPILDWIEQSTAVQVAYVRRDDVPHWAAGWSMKLFAYEVKPYVL